MGQATSATGWAWMRDITRYQWMIFLIAWLGWSLDNTDFNLFSLVLRPAMTELFGWQSDRCRYRQSGRNP